MKAAKKTSADQNSAYKLEAAARRVKVASMDAPIAGEVKPSGGRIRVKLSGKAISPDRHLMVFGRTSIDIPEFALARKIKMA